LWGQGLASLERRGPRGGRLLAKVFPGVGFPLKLEELKNTTRKSEGSRRKTSTKTYNPDVKGTLGGASRNRERKRAPKNGKTGACVPAQSTVKGVLKILTNKVVGKRLANRNEKTFSTRRSTLFFSRELLF